MRILGLNSKNITDKTVYIFFLLLPAVLLSQDYNKYDLNDFNNDGYVDTLKSYSAGGSGIGGTYISLVNGKSGEKFELNNDGYFCDFKQVILIPQSLRKEINKTFLEVIKSKLLPAKISVPDGSLEWLINANLNHKMLDDNSFYDLIIKSPTQWISGKFNFPKVGYIDVKGDTLRKLLITDDENPIGFDSIKDEGWLIYFAHNHFRNKNRDSLLLVDSSSIYKVYKTSHGVILKKGIYYSWVFVTDFRLTGGPEKLRWESIGDIKLIGKYIIVQMINSYSFSNPIFIIDIEEGVSARLKHYDEDFEPFTFDNGKINLKIGNSVKSFLITELFKELENVKL
jgi:hypothetical protein